MILVTVSGTSIMVLRTANLLQAARGQFAAAAPTSSLGWIVPRSRQNVTTRAVSGYSASSSASMRSFATARETVLFTVPRLTPSTSATSASVMSS